MANKKTIEKKPKVIVAMAVQDTIKSKTALSLICALREADFDYDMIMNMGCDLIGSRTRLVRMAIERGGTHMLFLDHDMMLNPAPHPITGKMIDPITQLLKADKDIIGAPYHFRSLPLRPTALALSDMSDKTKLYRCNAIGTGFMLIKLSVFDKIAKPWFNFARNENAEMVYGEDAWLCKQAIEAGIEVWADGSLNIGHLGEYEY